MFFSLKTLSHKEFGWTKVLWNSGICYPRHKCRGNSNNVLRMNYPDIYVGGVKFSSDVGFSPKLKSLAWRQCDMSGQVGITRSNHLCYISTLLNNHRKPVKNEYNRFAIVVELVSHCDALNLRCIEPVEMSKRVYRNAPHWVYRSVEIKQKGANTYRVYTLGTLSIPNFRHWLVTYISNVWWLM